jgi:tetratricopeptide (TPR) repeat protein
LKKTIIKEGEVMRRTGIILLLLIIICTLSVEAQQLTFPRESQAASVHQRIGITDITITYSRPAVKGRAIWGKLVPYNQVWRAGANENTTITFTEPVKVNGKDLAAGSYGIHTIPSENEWALIFSKQYTGWGSYAYDEKEDALRLTVKPEKTEFTEFLEYSFTNPDANSVLVNLKWEELSVPFNIEVDVPAAVVKKFRKDLIGSLQFNWQALNQAAAYCLNNKVYLEEAERWADKSISINRNFNNMNTKARILEMAGKKQESEELKAAAMQIATEADINAYGYQLLGQNKTDEAIEIFSKNVKNHPDSWNTYDSLAEAYAIKGDKKKAMENYNIAMSKVSDEQNKTRIRNAINQLEENQ